MEHGPDQLKDEALAEMQRCRRHVILTLRDRLVAKLQTRHLPFVTSDNARHIFEHEVVPDLMGAGLAVPHFRSIAGMVFHDSRFVATGAMVKSGYRRNHSALIACWRLA